LLGFGNLFQKPYHLPAQKLNGIMQCATSAVGDFVFLIKGEIES